MLLNYYLEKIHGNLQSLSRHFYKARGYRNEYPFHESENIVLEETDPFHEDLNCAWSNGYPFAEAANRPRGNGYVP